MTAIAYIGKKPFFDRLYGTGLTFDVGQVRDVPHEAARSFLRHQDLFALADEAPKEPKNDKAPKEPKNTNQDDTQQLMEEQTKLNEQKLTDQKNLEDLYVQVSVMDKDALEQFAKDRYQIDLNKRKSLENLREEVVGLIDQFGVV